jgi:hypothetical protein
MQTSNNSSLIIDRPIGGTLLRALFVLVILLAVLEGAARTPWVVRQLGTPSFGSYHYQFEIKWFQLQKYVDKHDGVDILFLGSSLVNSGIEPEAVNQAWMQATGEPALRIFNFGVEGLTIAPNSVLARILVETYHPRVIIFGTEIRDYAANNGVETAEKFLSDAWIQYRTGKFNLRGWLAEYSAAYRYFLAYRNWMSWDFAENHSNVIKRTNALTDDGYDIENRVAENPYLPPDPSDPEDAEAFAVFAGFEIADSRLNDLNDLLGIMQASDTRVMVVEMPVTPQFFEYFEAGEEAHQEFLTVVSDKVTAAGSIFYPGIPEEQLPENGRSDRVHLSKYGATVFSQYLGEWLGELYLTSGMDLRQEEGAP